jgi:hypothetical protein
MGEPDRGAKKMFEARTLSVMRLTRAVVPAMQRNQWGCFVHIGCLVAKEPERSIPRMAHSTVLFCLVMLLRGLSDEYAVDALLVAQRTIPAGRDGAPRSILGSRLHRLAACQLSHWRNTRGRQRRAPGGVGQTVASNGTVNGTSRVFSAK